MVFYRISGGTMESRKNVLVILIISILLVMVSIIFFTRPRIILSLIGDETINLNVGEEYVEFGANAIYKRIGKEENLPHKVIGNVDTNKIGNYIITYEANYKYLINKITRKVNVLDLEKPTLTLNSPVYLCQNNKSINLDVTAYDNYDGDLTEKVEYKIIDDKINIYVEDSSHNKTVESFDINYKDSEKPTIKLNGSTNLYIELGSTYKEEGATAYDSCDGDLTDKIKITGNVDTFNEGEYIVTYVVADSSNNKVNTTRKVTVYKTEKINFQNPENAYIYLTFDDGPGQYTEKLLKILADNDIKATFFVTNQFPKYQYLIKKEYEEGHTIGIHTYSHKWTIYDSIDNYLNDFNMIQDIVIEQTGVTPKFFRFPGGTSNQVAKIPMSTLASIMTEKGYIYFDWNIDSGDTHKKNTKDYIINLVKNNLKGNAEYIILMHDIKKNTLEALPEIIKYAKSKGYVFKAIDDNTSKKQFKPYK